MGTWIGTGKGVSCKGGYGMLGGADLRVVCWYGYRGLLGYRYRCLLEYRFRCRLGYGVRYRGLLG